MIINSYIIKSGPSYPSSLKLFIDAGDILSYPGSGTTINDLTGNQNGTLYNGVAYSSSNGGILQFDGANDYIDFGINTIIQPTSARTQSIWFYTTDYGGMLFADGDYNADRNGVSIPLDAKRVELANGSTYNFPAWDGTWNTNTWYYLTIRWSGFAFSVLQNGVQISTSTLTISPTNGVFSTILGASNSGASKNRFGHFNFGQMKIYNVALSDADVLTDFNEFKTRYGY